MKLETIILTRQQVSSLLTLKECILAVESVFKLYGQGNASPPGILGMHATDGGFHIKAGILQLERSYFVAKVNANFPGNKKVYGLPTIQGVIALCDASNGQLLALMDSIEITIVRTGAATAVAAKYLANPNSKVATIIGCGNQGRISVSALHTVLPIEQVFVFDVDHSTAETLASELSNELPIQVSVSPDIHKSVQSSDVCVTCTTSKQPVLRWEDIPPGIFIAAVGADHEEKQELEPAILAKGKLVTDLTEQCCHLGELHHAIQGHVLHKENVYAELGDVVSGKKMGRSTPEEIIIFDSTGMALQDVAVAAIVYERAVEKGIGLKVNLAN